MVSEHHLSERRACRLVGLSRDSYRHPPEPDPATVELSSKIVGNPPDKPKDREVEFSNKEVLREEVEIYRQPNHGCLETC